MNLDDILEAIESNVPNVTDRAYTAAASRAASRFFRESRVWTETLDAVSLVAGVQSYELYTPNGTNLSEIANVFYNGSEIYSDTKEQLHANECGLKYDREGSTLLLYPTPANSERNAIVVRAVIVPDIRENLPRKADYYFDKYGDAIVAAACVRLCKMPNKNWTNNSAANIYEGEYQEILVEAMREGKGFTEKRIMIARPAEY